MTLLRVALPVMLAFTAVVACKKESLQAPAPSVPSVAAPTPKGEIKFGCAMGMMIGGVLEVP